MTTRAQKADDLLAQTEGYYTLGLLDDAWDALDTLGPDHADRLEVLLLRHRILFTWGRWRKVIAIGVRCCRCWPKTPEFFEATAEALANVGDHEKALTLLLSGPSILREMPRYHFLRARCEARLSRLREARASLKQCFQRDKDYRLQALHEADLADFWTKL